MPGIVGLTDLVADSSGVARIVLEAVQEMLLLICLMPSMRRLRGDNYDGRLSGNYDGR